MTRRAKIAIISVGFLVMAVSHSNATPLSGSEIKSLLSNKNLTLHTSLGSMPMRYRSNGTVTGDGTSTGLARLFAPKETGTWWVKGNKMCQKWPTWYDGKTYCFKLTKTGSNKLRWIRNDGYSGKATLR